MEFFISSAFAQDMAAGAQQPSLIANLVPLILIVVVFYFLLIRPQQKRLKEHQQMVEALRRGDKIITSGGIIGTIAKVDADELHVEIAKDVQVKVVRSTVTTVIGRGTVSKDAKSDASTDASPKKRKSTKKNTES